VEGHNPLPRPFPQWGGGSLPPHAQPPSAPAASQPLPFYNPEKVPCIRKGRMGEERGCKRGRGRKGREHETPVKILATAMPIPPGERKDTLITLPQFC